MRSAKLIYERRVSPAAQWAQSVSTFAVVLVIISTVGHRYGMVETLAFVWVALLAAAIALFGVVLAALGLGRLWFHGDKAGRASFIALVVSGIVLLPFAAMAYFAFRYPALTDISTDLAEPPRFFFAQRARTAPMNAITPIAVEAVQLQREAYPDVTGRRLDASMERVLSATTAVIAARGWKPRSSLPEIPPEGGELTIEMEAPTYIVRFPADAVVRLTDEGESTFVDMRMNSRYGGHDFGDNARRIRSFMDDLDAEFARQSLSIIDIPASAQEEDAVE